jgi:hypothetical protein
VDVVDDIRARDDQDIVVALQLVAVVDVALTPDEAGSKGTRLSVGSRHSQTLLSGGIAVHCGARTC